MKVNVETARFLSTKIEGFIFWFPRKSPNLLADMRPDTRALREEQLRRRCAKL